jgi:curved DNA-binding protein CbpA
MGEKIQPMTWRRQIHFTSLDGPKSPGTTKGTRGDRLADGSRIPRVVIEASALRSLPLGAADGFVLSRIDGRASERELAGLTGLPEMQIRTSIEKLLSLKAIAFGPPPALPPPKPSRGSGSMAAVSVDGGSQPAIPVATPSDPKLPEAPPLTANALLAAAIAGIPEDAPELAEEVDLPIELRRRVLGLHSVVNSLDHYALLAVGRDADKKTVKRSYFELAAVFHPDRYFRKNLGSFKSRMENIFGKVSTAYETLTDKEQRAEYDVYLGDVEKSRNVELMLRNVMAEAEQAEQSVLAAAAGSGLSIPSPPSAGAAQAKEESGSYSTATPRSASTIPGATPAPPVTPPPAGPLKTSVSDQLRREALAMRLKGLARPSMRPAVEKAPVSTAQPVPLPRASPSEAMDAIKRRYEDKVEAGRQAQGKKYVALAETAESRNDLTAAAASYRVALTFLREDEPAYARAKEVITKSELSLGETYARQADHEEKGNRWEDAARSWGRAVKLRPSDHRAHERYAHALVRASGDLHEAAQVGQKAVAMAPTMGDYRCTLATVYAAAGLLLNAKRELEAAALQFPENPNIPILLKKLLKPTP